MVLPPYLKVVSTMAFMTVALFLHQPLSVLVRYSMSFFSKGSGEVVINRLATPGELLYLTYEEGDQNCIFKMTLINQPIGLCML